VKPACHDEGVRVMRIKDKAVCPYVFSEKKHITQMGHAKSLTYFSGVVEFGPIMFRDRASILMEAKSKRKPMFTTSVVGSGHVLVNQEKSKDSL
jgi:hypothetical protein